MADDLHDEMIDEPSLDEVVRKLDDVVDTLGDVAAEVRGLREDVDSMEHGVADLKDKLGDLERDLEARRLGDDITNEGHYLGLLAAGAVVVAFIVAHRWFGWR